MMADSEGVQAQASRSSESSPSQPEAAGQSNRGALFIVFLVVFIDLLGFGIVLPLLPLYAKELLAPLIDNETYHGLVLALLMSSFSAMQFIFAPIWGRVSDRIGRRPILLMGLAGSVVFYTLFGVASEIGIGGNPALGLTLMFIARLGAGIAGATIATAQAVIADSTTPERRSHGMALIGVAFGIGFTFGPLLGFASLFVPSEGAPGFVAAAFSLLALLLGLRLLPETLRAGGSAAPRRWFDWHGWQNTLRTPSIGILVATFFMATWAFGSLESTLALVNKLFLDPESDLRSQLTREAAKTTERKNFLVFAYVGLILMLTQGLFYRRLVQRVGEVKFLRIGTVFMGLGLAGAVGILLGRQAVAPWAASRPVLISGALLVMSLAVIGFACLTPSVQALISRRSDPAKQGEVLGVNQSAAALARILGPMLGPSLFFVNDTHYLPFAFGAGLLALAFVLSLKIKQE